MAAVMGKTTDGRPLFGVVDSKSYRNFKDQRGFPWLLEIYVDMKDVRKDGLPTGNELAALTAFQESLLADLKRVTEGHKVGHITGGGIREIYVYLHEPKAAHQLLTAVTKAAPSREFEYQIRQDPKWKCAASLMSR